MLNLDISPANSTGQKILCLGAHSDDIEIGCGGAILKIIQNYPDSEIYWIVFSAIPQRAEEAATSASLFLKGINKKKIIIKNFKDGFFPYMGFEIKGFFEQLKQEFSPDLIFTHYRYDLHQDHRLISELTWNTYRNHLILQYEIPKYDADLGSPNFFVHLDETICNQKIDYLLKAFPTQREKHWFTDDTFRAILRIRGLESNSLTKYAEAFHCRKVIWAAGV